MASKVNLDVSQTLNITCRRGDSFQLNIQLKDAQGNPIDLDGTESSNAYKFAMQVRTSADQDGASGLIASTVEGLPNASVDYRTIEEILGDGSGNIEILIDDLTMKDFPPGRFVYDLQYRIPEGAVNGKDLTRTILKGAFVVNDDVTDSTTPPDRSSRTIDGLPSFQGGY